MKHKKNEPERIDLNLDEEPIAESPLDEGGVMPAVEESLPAAEDESADAVQEALVAQLAKLQAEKDEMYQTLVRRQADFENFRKRVDRERQEDVRRGAAMLMESVLPVFDAFERALEGQDGSNSQQYRQGFELIYKQLKDALTRQGLERIPAKGEPFDPHVHQAVERVETSDVEEGTVLEELQPGYRYKGSVLRPTMVRVAVEPRSADSAGPESPVN